MTAGLKARETAAPRESRASTMAEQTAELKALPTAALRERRACTTVAQTVERTTTTMVMTGTAAPTAGQTAGANRTPTSARALMPR